MLKTLKNEEGITLVELIASLAILSVVILLVGSVHIFGQTQFISQTESANQSNDLRYSLSLVSRDARLAGLPSEGEYAVDGGYQVGEVFYEFNRPQLKRSGELLSKRVAEFEIVAIDNEKAEIRIQSTGNRQNKSEEYQTTIYFRR